MGKRLRNWLSKTSVGETRTAWKSRWLQVAIWDITEENLTEENPLTGEPYLSCGADEVATS
jgi:hypothetical protein